MLFIISFFVKIFSFTSIFILKIISIFVSITINNNFFL